MLLFAGDTVDSGSSSNPNILWILLVILVILGIIYLVRRL